MTDYSIQQTFEDEEQSRSVYELCASKADEFHLLGYEHVTAEEIWICASESYFKKGLPAFHQVVNDILSLKVTAFMNFMTLSAYKGLRM